MQHPIYVGEWAISYLNRTIGLINCLAHQCYEGLGLTRTIVEHFGQVVVIVTLALVVVVVSKVVIFESLTVLKVFNVVLD